MQETYVYLGELFKIENKGNNTQRRKLKELWGREENYVQDDTAPSPITHGVSVHVQLYFDSIQWKVFEGINL